MAAQKVGEGMMIGPTFDEAYHRLNPTPPWERRHRRFRKRHNRMVMRSRRFAKDTYGRDWAAFVKWWRILGDNSDLVSPYQWYRIG
jgi:hypothetical protein